MLKRPLWNVVYGVARTLLALATCATLAANSPLLLFGTAHCNGPRAISLFCRCGGSLDLARWIAVAILLVVASGWRPALTAPLHWWVTFSFVSSAAVIDGGDQIASILAMLLLPVALLDRRRWHWDPEPAAERPYARAAATAAWHLIRLQVAFIYLHAAVGKLAVAEWLDGTAIYYWLNDPTFGAPPLLLPLVNALLRNAAVVAAMTWGAILLELALFASLFAPPHVRRTLFLAGIAFHAFIAVLFGLPSFSLTMAAALILYLEPPLDIIHPYTYIAKTIADKAFPAPALRRA